MTTLRDKVTDGIGDLYAQRADTQWEWVEAQKKTESPIETAFLIALQGYAEWHQHTVYIGGEPDGRDDEDWIHILPQAKIGDYRVDFLITFSCAEAETNGRESFIVECDGHDFHDRTPFQASRDRKRDRVLVMDGYKVFRFTGRDIYRGVIDYVADLMEFIYKRRDIAGDPELRGRF